MDWRRRWGWRCLGRLVLGCPGPDAACELAAIRDIRVVVQDDLVPCPMVRVVAAGDLRDDLAVGAVQDHWLVALVQPQAPFVFYGCPFLGHVDFLNAFDRYQDALAAILFLEELTVFQC